MPLMLLSSKKAEEIVDNFQYGIDGYLVKPYNFDELLCRMAVFLRRSRQEPEDHQPVRFELGDMVFDFKERQLKSNRVEFELTKREAEARAEAATQKRFDERFQKLQRERDGLRATMEETPNLA